MSYHYRPFFEGVKVEGEVKTSGSGETRMYCPKCGAQNIDDAKFCRACGMDLRVVSQALTGRVVEAGMTPPADVADQRAHSKFVGSVSAGFVGVAFIMIAALLLLWKAWWGVWLLVPGFAMLGRGVAACITAKYQLRVPAAAAQPAAMSSPSRPAESLLHGASELNAPPSVTEQTTRMLDPTKRS